MLHFINSQIKRLLLVAGLWSLVSLTTLSAANIYVDHQATGANNGSSWADAYTTLTPALSGASAGDAIYVSKGTYSDNVIGSFILKEGVRLFGGCPPSITNDPSGVLDFYRLLLRNNLNYPTNLTGTNVLKINSSLSSATSVNGFNIQGNNSGVSTFTLAFGSLVEPIFSNCSFSNGSYGVLVFTTSSQVTIKPHFINSTFSNQTVGVKLLTGGLNTSTNIHPKFSRCKFYNLTNAVAIEHVKGSMRPYFQDCRFYDNSSYAIKNSGPGIYNNQGIQCNCGITYDYQPKFVNSEFYNNKGVADLLLGVRSSYSDLAIDFTNCTMWNNIPQNQGSTAFNVVISQCLLNAPWNNNSSEVALKFNNSILWNNGEAGNGPWLTLQKGMRATVDNSLIHAASDANTDPAYVLPNPPTTSNQVICNAGVKYNQNPSFVNASGATPDLKLTVSSPAKNAGLNSLVPVDVDKDLNGYIRILENIVDMGAYEYCKFRGGCIPRATSAPIPLDRIQIGGLRTTDSFTSELTVYPNPVQNTLNIKGSHSSITLVQLMSLDGKILKQWTENQNLVITDVPAGMYVLKIQMSDDIKTIKIVKR